MVERWRERWSGLEMERGRGRGLEMDERGSGLEMGEREKEWVRDGGERGSRVEMERERELVRDGEREGEG